MNDALLESLLREDEGTSLDFKRDQYPFVGVTDDNVKSELLKDILAFANSWKRSDAYILVGVDEVSGGRSNIVGVVAHLPDASLQEFVNKKIQRPLIFSYEAYPYEGLQIGVIHIPRQERPFYLKSDYGKLKGNTVYIRRGSSTDVASLDEIAKMGIVGYEELNTHIELLALAEELNDFIEKSSSINIQKQNVNFVTDQYDRLIDKGIIIRLDVNMRKMLREVYAEIKLINHTVSVGWDSGRGSNVWAMNVNAANESMIKNRTMFTAAHDTLIAYLATFG